MSRSRRKTPICGLTTTGSEKEDKMISSRAFRRKVREALKNQKEAPLEKEIRDPWKWSKDGKQYFDPRKKPKLMRK